MKVKGKRGKHYDKLIAAVQAREILWDKNYRGHRNRYKLDRYWNEVAVEIGSTTLDCRKRWKNLKDQCRKEMKKDMTKSEWPHFNKLQFIHHLFLTDDEEGDIDANEDSSFNPIDEENDTKRQRLGFTMRKKLITTKKRTLKMDTNKLIELVKERDIIWNRQNKRHHNWHKLDSSWKEIAEQLGVSRDEARIKWKYIRDTARKEYRKPDSDWQYISKLEFLINQFSEYNEEVDDDFGQEFLQQEDDAYFLVDEQVNEVKEDEFDEFDTKPMIFEADFCDDDDDQVPSTSVPIVEANVVGKPELVDGSKDEDVGFFNSLLPHIRKLSPAKKMMMRIKIQEIVYNTVYNNAVL